MNVPDAPNMTNDELFAYRLATYIVGALAYEGHLDVAQMICDPKCGYDLQEVIRIIAAIIRDTTDAPDNFTSLPHDY